jgi:glycine/serine hydroxymethyltransferase
MKEPEMRRIVAWMDEVIANADDEQALERIRNEVRDFCVAFPAPGIRIPS